jgi:nicotinamide phosphoribosyltransferase
MYPKLNDSENLVLLADAYKYSHHKLYYPGTTKVYSYLESRGGVFDETVFYGLQYFLKKYISGEVFTREKIDEAEDLNTFTDGIVACVSDSFNIFRASKEY